MLVFLCYVQDFFQCGYVGYCFGDVVFVYGVYVFGVGGVFDFVGVGVLYDQLVQWVGYYQEFYDCVVIVVVGGVGCVGVWFLQLDWLFVGVFFQFEFGDYFG